ncbi:hypothetical protein CRENBAI_023572 [Crenichthys baileyi]|uniref:Uncharacterized protein n=1 Tax=Crenichthys baileyi TaxID=28760 RepID=A0AAV9QZE3_9TELE
MMLERTKMTVVADIIFTQSQTPEKEDAVFCRCSRAFVEDRELYRSDNRLLSSGKEDTEVQATVHYESKKEEEEQILDEESQLMAMMGLPLAFASSSEQKIRKRGRPHRKPITRVADKEADKDLQQVYKTDECQNKLQQVVDVDEEVHDTCWESYWAQNGHDLLWSSWLEKHPDTSLSSADDVGAVAAPWDNPDTKALWDTLAAETYYSYWERFSYWTALGWTTDPRMCNWSTGEDVQTDTQTQSNEQTKGKTGAGNQERERKVDVMSFLFRETCTIQESRSCATDLEANRYFVHSSDVRKQSDEECCCCEDPSDGGNDQKEPAGTSKENTAKQTDSMQLTILPDRIFSSNSKMSERREEEDDDGDEHPRRFTKIKRSHELDMEECPHLTPEEVWSELGLKHKLQPPFGTVVRYKDNSPKPQKSSKVVSSINKHIRFSEMDADNTNPISPSLYKAQNFLQNVRREAQMKMIKRNNVGPVEEEGYDHESTSETKIMENNACNTSSNFSKRSVEVPREEEHPGGSLTFQEKVDLIPLNTLEGQKEKDVMKPNKNPKRRKKQQVPAELAGDTELAKYWAQRYRLFSLFDDGIRLDRDTEEIRAIDIQCPPQRTRGESQENHPAATVQKPQGAAAPTGPVGRCLHPSRSSHRPRDPRPRDISLPKQRPDRAQGSRPQQAATGSEPAHTNAPSPGHREPQVQVAIAHSATRTQEVVPFPPGVETGRPLQHLNLGWCLGWCLNLSDPSPQRPHPHPERGHVQKRGLHGPN